MDTKRNLEIGAEIGWSLVELVYWLAAFGIAGSKMNPVLKVVGIIACVYWDNGVDKNEVKRNVIKKYTKLIEPEQKEEKKPNKNYSDGPKGTAQCRIGF